MAKETHDSAQTPSIELAVEALAAQCDGARKRDGKGFSRADASEGGRLAALSRAGVPWSQADVSRALEMLGRHANQAASALAGGDGAKVRGIEGAIRSGRLPLAVPATAAQPPYNLACPSSGGKKAYFWRLAWVADLGGLSRDLRAIGRLRHGERRIHVRQVEKAELTVSGTRKRANRWEIDFNGTSQPLILAAARRHGFALDPALEGDLDSETDILRRSARSAWLHRGVRDGQRGVWAVFDLASKHEPFSAEVKRRLRGRFQCDPNDDWNWFVPIGKGTNPIIMSLLERHGFAASEELLRTVKGAGSAA